MLHYITVYYMFRLSKISHHQVLPALVINEQCAEILLVWGGARDLVFERSHAPPTPVKSPHTVHV